MTTHDIERTRQIYQECLKLIPHKKFTFAKVWLLAAQFEVRQGQLSAARKTLGTAIGMCPKDKLFRGYIDLEMKLFEFGRCRQLYNKYIEWNPSNWKAWDEFAKLERGLDDIDRARGIYELAVEEPELDMPERVWKAYIDFEEEEGEYEKARALFERLLAKTNHVKVWISYAQFEIGVPEGDEDEAEDRPVSEAAKERARKIFERAYKVMKEHDLKEEVSPIADRMLLTPYLTALQRVALLNAWKSFETTHGSEADIEKVTKQMPRKVKKRRRLDDNSFEEYMDYVFPADDESQAKFNKLLELAHKWKKEKVQEEGS